MEKVRASGEHAVVRAQSERIVDADGTIAHIFTGSGDVLFDGPETYIPHTPQSPRMVEPIIIDTEDGSYVIGRGVMIEGRTGLAYDISDVGKERFPSRISLGEPFEVPGIPVTPAVVQVGVKHPMSYFDPDNLEGGQAAAPSPFRQVAQTLEQASNYFNEVSPGRERTLYREDTGEAYIEKSESLLKKFGRGILERMSR